MKKEKLALLIMKMASFSFFIGDVAISSLTGKDTLTVVK